jgi:hypothetical protein
MSVVIDSVKNINIAYNTLHNDPTLYIFDYQQYCVDLIKEKALLSERAVNIIFGEYSIDFKNNNPVIRIDAQYEHTLVREGGRSVDSITHGNVRQKDNNPYLVRIQNFNYLNTLDFIFEYSLPNIFNIQSAGIFANYLAKTIYISPSWFEINFSNSYRTEIITLHTNNPRREQITNRINDRINIKNITNCVRRTDLQQLFSRTKILVNIHQTEHHHTFEELRVLPALLNGVIIISEDVPLKETIPYSDYIIWTDYNDIPSVVADVASNYQTYYQKLFIESPLTSILKDMKKSNFKNLDIIGF